jgi:hypothetical protein
MKLSAIAMARATILVEVETLDPKGRAFAPAVFSTFGAKYSFVKIPQKLDEIDPQKGIKFEVGKAGEIVVDSLTIFKDGIVVDTRSSTEDSEKVILELLTFAGEAFGATARPTRKLFVSQIIFTSDLKLSALNPILQPLTNKLSERVSEVLGQRVEFEPTGIVLSPDPSLSKINPAGFTIERRANIPFSENTYFSSAPLRTSDHIELIREVEIALGF